MKTAVAITSIRSYDQLRASGFSLKHADILSVMLPGYTYTRRELASMLNMETSSMSARIHELLKSGQVEINGCVTCTLSGKDVEGVKLVEVIQ